MSEKRQALTVAFKRKVLEAVENNPNKKKLDIAKEFNIAPSTLATIIKNKDKYVDEGGLPSLCKKSKKGELQDVEEAVVRWLKQCRDKNLPISGPVLQEKAQQFAAQLGHSDFRASNGWLNRFKKRHEISFKKVCGESAAIDDTVCDKWKDSLQDLISGYDPDDIYNADETGLFFRCLPDKTLAFKGDNCNGGKNSKERLTVLLCTNASGKNKLKPLVIGKSKNPRCFKNIQHFPTDYTSNKKAWMNGEAFSDWLKKTNKDMKNKKKNILLFIDNCTAHGDVPRLSNIKVHFLPPNTTSKLQPLDQGIIQNFKTNYRREVVRQFLSDMETQTPTKISVLDAMWMTAKAWNNVTENTIANCFKKSGFVFNEPQQDGDEGETQREESVNIETSWDKVIEALNVQMDFAEFVDFDDQLAVCGELSDADILASVREDVVADDEMEEDEDGEVSDEPLYTSKDAREAIKVLKNFFQNKDSLTDAVVRSITEIDCAIDQVKMKSSKQTTINDFFSKGNASTNSD